MRDLLVYDIIMLDSRLSALNRKIFRRGAINMRAIKRTVSVLLTLMLILGMVTIGIGAASAAESYKINVTSNIDASASKVYNASSETVTITFNLKAANVIGTRGVITYDKSALSLADTTAKNIFPNTTAGLVANTTKTDGRIPFSAYSLNGYDFDNSNVFATLTFNILNCTKDVTVNLDLQDLIGSTTIPNKNEEDEVAYIDNDTIKDASAYTATVTETISPETSSPFINDVRLALEGKIGLNFYFFDSPAGYTASNIKVEFNGPVSDFNKVVKLTSLPRGTRNGVAVRSYTYYVYAPMMTETVTVKIWNGSTRAEVYTITVADWVTQHVAEFENSAPKVVSLMKDMLNYGYATQVYFDYNTNNLANANNDKKLVLIASSRISVPSGLAQTPNLTSIGARFNKCSAEIKEGTALRLYVNVTDSTKFSKATVSCGGTNLSFSGSGTQQVAILDNIAAAYLDTVYTFNFSNGATYKQSVMNYLKGVLENNSSDSNTKKLVSAIYWYNQSANDFFGE